MKARHLLLLLSLACCGSARADRGTEQVALAANGRFDRLEQMLEAQARQGPLDTRDRHALCYAYSRTKRYAQLMSCLDQLALNLQNGGDHSTRLFALDDATPALGLMRAEALSELGQYEAAVSTARANLEWLEKDRGDDMDMLYNSMAALSVAYTLSGERDKGAAMAARIARGGGMFSSYSSAQVLALARARMALGDYQGVLAALDSDKLFAVNVFLDRLVSASYFTGVNNWLWVELPRAFMLNKSLLEIGRIDDARAGFDRLLALPQVKENGEIYWLMLFERGRIAEQSDAGVALSLYQKAIDVVELQRASINTEANKIGFVGDKQALYARAIGLAQDMNRTELAYDLIERSKSRALVDLLAMRSGAPRLHAQNINGARLLALYEEASEQATAQLPTDMARAGSEAARNAARTQVLQLKSADPALASLLSVDALNLPQVRRHLRPDEVLVEYYLNGSQLILVCVSADRVMSATLDGKQIEGEVRAFRKLIAQRSPRVQEVAHTLYARLLAPAGTIIAGRNLLIVPHGALHYLPFAALHDGKDFLLARHELRFLPSASVQEYMRKDEGAKMGDILILGNPDLGDPRLDLPGTEQEAKQIAQIVANNRVLTRKTASETAFKQYAGQYSYLHVAAHGEFHGESPLQSRLALSPDRANDGSLTVSEVYALRLNADLVTLSACETGLNKAQNGDDLIGMTRGFLYAGSSNILASLWEVDDQATAALMAQFYRNVKAGQRKGAALRAAQETLRARYPEPYYWAAFYLTGQGV